MKLIPIGVLSLLVLILVGATVVVAWPMILVGAFVVALSKGADLWNDRSAPAEA